MKVLLSQKMEGIGGSEIYLTHIAPAIAGRGIDVTLAIIYEVRHETAIRDYMKKIDNSKVKVALFTISKIPRIHELRKINRYIKQEKFDLVHSHLMITDFIFSLVKTLFFRPFILVSTKHGYNEEYINKYGFKVHYRLLDPYRALLALIERRVNYSFAVSNAIQQLFIGLQISKPHKIGLIYYGFDYPDIRIEKKLLPAGDQNMLLVGRLVEYKGHRFAIEAMSHVVKTNPGAKLYIVGIGYLRAHLEEMVNELELGQNIIFMGFHPVPRMLMAEGTLVLMPSVVEGFGLVVLEAMSCAKSVIAFDVPAPNEIIKNGENGLLATPYDATELANHMVSLLNNAELRKAMGEKAYVLQRTYFNLQRMTDETIEVYKKTLSGH